MTHYITKEDIRGAFPERGKYSNKGDFGYISLIGGCEKYSGAIRLAYLANAAMRSGAGVCRVAVPRGILGAVAANVLESTVYPLSSADGGIRFVQDEAEELLARSRAAAVGMGIGLSGDVTELLRFILKRYDGRLLIDADGLTTLAGLLKEDGSILKDSAPSVVLTPHLKEFSRLTGISVDELKMDSDEADAGTGALAKRIGYAREFAEKHGVVLLLKGPPTIVTDGRNVNIVDTGCPGMATAGSGDVLSGILAGLMGYNGDMMLAATAAAYLNGIAGELAQEKVGAISQIASDTVAAIPEAILSITGKR